MGLLRRLVLRGNALPPVQLATVYAEVQQIIGRYSFASQFVKDKAVLEVACGSGYGLSYWMSKGARMATGGDIWKEAIAYANEHYQQKGLRSLRLDAARLPFRNSSFDVIISIETLEHLREYEDFIEECGRVLKDGGVFVCSTPNSEGFLSERRFLLDKVLDKIVLVPDEHNFHPEELQDLLDIQFKTVSLYGIGSKLTYGAVMRFKLGSLLKYLAFSYPKVGKLIGIVTRWSLLKEFRPMKLPRVEDFDGMLDKEYFPYPLGGQHPVSPHTIIAVAKK